MRPGLTLVELLVATVIIGILALVAVVAAGRLRELAGVQAARMELRQVTVAIEHYRISEGVLPASLDDLAAAGYYEPSADVPYCEFHVHDKDGYVHARASYRGSTTHVELRYPGSPPTVVPQKAKSDCAE